MDPELFQNRYRIASIRLPWWDYGGPGKYFVTICTKFRFPWFGDIINGTIQLSEIGKIAKTSWSDIPKHFPTVSLDEFIIMPDHVHGIVVNDPGVEAQNFAPLPPGNNSRHNRNRFGPQSKNLASFIRGFKIGVTKYARNINPDFSWQPRYYEHIIRDEPGLYAVRRYIRDNPKNAG